MRIPIALSALALAACDGGTGAAPRGGEFIAALESPNGPEGAALLELTGEGIESVAGSSVELFQLPINGGRRVMLVSGRRIERGCKLLAVSHRDWLEMGERVIHVNVSPVFRHADLENSPYRQVRDHVRIARDGA